MPDQNLISAIRFSAAPRRDLRSGLLGFVAFEYAGLKFDGIGLRRTVAGRPVLSFPRRTDSYGQRHEIVHPADEATRRQIESAVFAALRLDVDEAHP